MIQDCIYCIWHWHRTVWRIFFWIFWAINFDRKSRCEKSRLFYVLCDRRSYRQIRQYTAKACDYILIIIIMSWRSFLSSTVTCYLYFILAIKPC